MNWLLKKIAHRYIKQACAKRCNAQGKDFADILTLMFKEMRKRDTESNDSTIYAVMLDEFIDASRDHLEYVSPKLRKQNGQS